MAGIFQEFHAAVKLTPVDKPGFPGADPLPPAAAEKQNAALRHIIEFKLLMPVKITADAFASGPAHHNPDRQRAVRHADVLVPAQRTAALSDAHLCCPSHAFPLADKGG